MAREFAHPAGREKFGPVIYVVVRHVGDEYPATPVLRFPQPRSQLLGALLWKLPAFQEVINHVWEQNDGTLWEIAWAHVPKVGGHLGTARWDEVLQLEGNFRPWDKGVWKG